MSQNNTNGSLDNERAKAVAITRAIENRDWDAFDRLTGLTHEETERILREEPVVDATEVFRMLGITDEEVREVLKSPPPEEFSSPKAPEKL